MPKKRLQHLTAIAEGKTLPSPSCRQDVQQTQLHMPMLQNFFPSKMPFPLTPLPHRFLHCCSADNKLNCFAKHEHPETDPSSGRISFIFSCFLLCLHV